MDYLKFPRTMYKVTVAWKIENRDASNKRVIRKCLEEQWLTSLPKNEHYFGRQDDKGNMFETSVIWFYSIDRALNYIDRQKVKPPRPITEEERSNLHNRIKQVDDELKQIKKKRQAELKNLRKLVFSF